MMMRTMAKSLDSPAGMRRVTRTTTRTVLKGRKAAIIHQESDSSKMMKKN
jgi:hypothetical protein